MKLTLINLDAPTTDYYFELHRADCRDIAKKQGSRIELDSIEAARDYIEADGIGWSLEEHCHRFGCIDN